MRQAILTDHGFQVREVPIPSCGPNQVLVRTLANGVCAGDVGRYRDTQGRTGQEVALGHEASGEVVEVGPNVTSLHPGDKVTALGGAFADYNVFSLDSIVKLPDSVSPLWALGEPVACCVHAMNRSRIRPGDRVAIVGSGFMGLICLQLARHFGAGKITAIDIVPRRLELARRFGAHRTQDARQLTIERLSAEGKYWNGDYDVVIEAAGTQPALDLCGYLVRQHGLVNLIGYHHSHGGLRNVNVGQWNFKAIDVVNGHVRREDEKCIAMQLGMEMAAQGKLQLEPLLTRYPLSRIQQAFEDCCAAGRETLIKAVIVPETMPG